MREQLLLPPHGFQQKPNPVKPLEFDIPAEATRDGALTLEWTRPPGLGGNGRGCQVSEVWLIRDSEPVQRAATNRNRNEPRPQ